jgi:hypothetical protein
MLLGTIALAGLIIAVALLMLAAQRHFANKRLANERRNKDEDWPVSLVRARFDWQQPYFSLSATKNSVHRDFWAGLFI